MARTTLLLISPPVLYDPRLWPAIPCKPHIHSLAGFVRDVADVRVVELDVAMGAPQSLEGVDTFLEDLDEHIDVSDVDLVGISCWTSFHYLGTVAVAGAVRRKAPHLPIAVGGHHVTAVPTDFTDVDDLFDFVVQGDGEHALADLCESRPTRPARPRVVQGKPFEMLDPNTIDWAMYPWQDETNKLLWLNLSRGCPFACNFCMGRTRTSVYDVDVALDLLERLSLSHAPSRICLSDPMFGADSHWTEAFLTGLKDRGLNTRFWAETRADVLSTSLLQRLHESGFWVDFGLDTGSAQMVTRLGKSRSGEKYLKHARQILRHADAIGMPHLIYLLFNYPGETPETMQATMDFVGRLVDETGPVSGMVASQNFYILPGTQVVRELDTAEAQFGTRVAHPIWWTEPRNHHELATENLPSREFEGHENKLDQWKVWQKALNTRWSPRRPKEVNSLYLRMFGEG